MIKEFCSCGAITEYTLHKPKFCTGCGQPFGGTIVAKRAPVQSIKIKKTVEIEEDEEEESESSLDFSNLKEIQADIEFSGPSRIDGANLGAPDPNFAPRNAAKLSKKQLKQQVQDFQRKVLASRPIEID